MKKNQRIRDRYIREAQRYGAHTGALLSISKVEDRGGKGKIIPIETLIIIIIIIFLLFSQMSVRAARRSFHRGI